MQEVTVTNWCDNASAHTERVMATEPRVKYWLNNELVQFDMCDSCKTTLRDPLEKLANECGEPILDQKSISLRPQQRRRSSQPDKPRSYPCMLCTESYTGSSGLLLHYTKHHGVPFGIANMANIYGTHCPLCEHISQSNLGVHSSQLHGTSIPLVFAQAEQDGDVKQLVSNVRDRLKAMIAGSFVAPVKAEQPTA